jgi:hypothetical protein
MLQPDQRDCLAAVAGFCLVGFRVANGSDHPRGLAAPSTGVGMGMGSFVFGSSIAFQLQAKRFNRTTRMLDSMMDTEVK